MSDQMSRRGFMGAAATGAVALAGVALAGCSSTSASSEKSSEKEKTVKPVILVTSFGTSYNDSRHITIGAIEDAIREKYWQDYDIRRAFTAQIIIDKLKERDGITIDNMTEALDRCVEDGVKEIVVQPTHLMAGLEYTDVKDELDKYADKFDKISLGDPLLTSDDDFKKVAAAIKENMASFDDGKTALCLMGHGTEADSNADYAKMQEVFKNEGLTQFFVGTVEAEPTCEDVIAAASAAGYKKAVLAPFMVVAGDHANNDMADDDRPRTAGLRTFRGRRFRSDVPAPGSGTERRGRRHLRLARGRRHRQACKLAAHGGAGRVPVQRACAFPSRRRMPVAFASRPSTARRGRSNRLKGTPPC